LSCAASQHAQFFKPHLISAQSFYGTLQARLEAYLDKKRTAFPRFHFLANDDILHILSQSNEPAAVEPYLHKLFDGIGGLDTEGEGRSIDILAMRSHEGEYVKLAKVVRARGPPESAPSSCILRFRMSVRSVSRCDL
jgi:Dynein heavy chain, N-terminal region 2